MKGDALYLSDSLLIEKLAIMEVGLSKTAGMMDMLSGLGDSIKSEVSQVANDKGILPTIEEYLVTGTIIKLLGPWGWLISGVASLLGFDIGAFVSSILDFVKNKIKSTGTITLDDVNSAGKSLVQSHAGSSADDGLISHASNDMFLFLKKVEAEENLIKFATGYFESANEAIPFFGGKGGILGKIFGNLFNQGSSGKSKILMIIAGLIVWVIKTVLLGAGVTKASSLLNKIVNKNDSKNQEISKDNPIYNVSFNIPEAIPNSFKSSGDGNQYHINDNSSLWIVPLVNKDVAKTLSWWTTSIYPELKGHESEFQNTNSFNNMVSLLNSEIDPNHPEYARVPPGLHTRKDVVDRFAGEVKLKNDNSKDSHEA